MVALIVLVVINIFRIVAVRFFVAFAPLLIVLNFADKDKSYQTGLLEKFSIPNIIKSIFAPVIAVGLMSIGLIVIVIMQGFLQLNTNTIAIGDVNIESTGISSSVGVDGIFKTTMAGDLFGQNTGNLVKNTFSNILLIIFTLFILYGIVKALSMFLKDGIGGKFINDTISLGTNALGSLPMIPIPGGGFGSINSVGKVASNKFREIKGKFTTNTTDQDTAIQNMFREKVGMDLLPYSDTYKGLQSLKRKFTDSKSSISKDDYTNMIKEFTKEGGVKGYYKGLNQTISNFDSNTNTLQTFFQKLDNRAITSLGLSGQIDPRSQDPAKNETVETFITKNYNKNTELFNKIYADLGGDITKLKNATDKGKAFRTTPIQVQKEE